MRGTHSSTKDTTEVIEQTVLRPREQTKVLLGIYENLIPQPDFTVESKAAQAGSPYITANLVRVNNNGDYSLSYLLQNNSDTAVEVTIVERCVDSV